jgi:sulfur carrier protein
VITLKVTVKLFATFREGRDKIILMDVNENTTPMDILDVLKISSSEVAILLINGRDGEFTRNLNKDDVISVFPPVGGG